MTADANAAVAALVAAKDIASLEAAISTASFLDSVPGDNRQKLRGEYNIASKLVEASAELRLQVKIYHAQSFLSSTNVLQLHALGCVKW